MVLTVKEIIDLATLAGLCITTSLFDEYELETEITVEVIDGKKIAYYTEYPDEGVLPLG